MRLRLSCWAENLKKADGCFAVVTVLHKEQGVKPTVLGQTEVIRHATSAYSCDWTKTFLLHDYELGQEQHLVFSLYSGKDTPVGSTLFEVGHVLGNAGVQAKELKSGGGIIAVRLEEVSDSCGQLQVQLRGLHLKNMDGIGFGLNTSDPFFEFQRARKTTTAGMPVWDAVYRSAVVDNNLNPIFPKVCIDLDELGGNADAKFRLVVYDMDKNGTHKTIGEVQLTANDLIDNINDTALQDVAKIDTAKAFTLKNGKEETGKIVVVKAAVTGVVEAPDLIDPGPPASAGPEEVVKAVEPEEDVSVEAEIIVPVATSNDEVELEASDSHGHDNIRPTFVNYVAGGCQLRLIAAIDATASNGDPRVESSLHYFNDHGLNSYEDALQSICSILAKFDSDQKYPVFGFGAKVDGVINHCFPFGSTPEVDGVDGILQVYRETFRSGIVMSSPRDFSEVIRSAGTHAKMAMEKGQTYSILLVFTNGSPADSGAAIAALKDVDDAPLSVVFVGVGKEEDLASTKALEKAIPDAGCRDKVRFVHYRPNQDQEALTGPALRNIPAQLEAYFVSKDIYPEHEAVSDEIVVQPYNPAADVEVPMKINDAGEVTVTADVRPPDTKSSASAFSEMKRLGMDLHKTIKKNQAVVGKIKRTFNKKSMTTAKNKVNKLFGSKIL